MLENIHQEEIRNLIAPEIYDMLPQLPENHPVVLLQAYQLNLAQQKIIAEPYQKICTSLNDHFQRSEKERWNGDELWQYCQQNLNTMQQNPQQDQSYATFKSLREQIEKNEEERMQFCSQEETVECYVKSFMQIPVHTYFNQYGENNWLNYSPILMHGQKYRSYAINALTQLLEKNLIIVDEEGNIKHHYSYSEAPIEKDNTLFLCHIGNHHFNKLVFLEKNEKVEYINSLRPGPLLREEIQESSHKKEESLSPSPFLDLINCPIILDEGLKNLQSRLTKIGGSENKLKSLKQILLQGIESLEKGELQDHLKELKEFIPLLLSPVELIIASEKGDLGLTLGGFYFSSNKESPEDILTHKAFNALNVRIERCEHFASVLETIFKEGSLALREVKELYETYKQGFLQFNPKNINELKENYKHYLAPQAELYGTLFSPSLIQQSVAYQLVSRTLFNKVDKHNKEGTHAVRSFEGMHFKVYDYDTELGLCPGKELAMYHLYQLLIGEGVAPSTLICLA